MPGLLVAGAHQRPRALRGAGLTARSRPRLMPAPAEIGVFGGSGFYERVSGAGLGTVGTTYGTPRAPVSVAGVAGRRGAFLPRPCPRPPSPAPLFTYPAHCLATH